MGIATGNLLLCKPSRYCAIGKGSQKGIPLTLGDGGVGVPFTEYGCRVTTMIVSIK